MPDLAFLSTDTNYGQTSVTTLQNATQPVSVSPLSMKMAVGQYVIPDRDTLEKILRYETTIERSLDRAHARLDHLQKTRQVRERLDSDEVAEGSDQTTDES